MLKINKNYNSFWKDILEDDKGKLDMNQLKKELYDFYILIDNLSKLYVNVSGGLCSKPHTDANIVIELYEDHLNQRYQDGYNDAKDDFNV